MWIEKNKTGYVFRETYKDPLTGKYRKVSVTKEKHTRITEKAAAEELRLLILEKTNATGQILFFDLLNQYRESKRAFVSRSTYYNLGTLIARLSDRLPEETLFDRVTPMVLQKVIDDIVIKISPARASQVLGLVKQAYKYGVRMGLIQSDITPQRVIIPKQQKTTAQVKKEQEKYLSRDELSTVLKLLKNDTPSIALVCEFQALTGLRFGELAALRDEDYNAEKKEIDINGSLNFPRRKGDKPVRGQTKNAYSVRKILLNSRAVSIIERFVNKNKQRRLWDPSKHDKSGETYIFTNSDGGPLDISYVNRVLRRINFPKKISTHIFRHTHISLLAEAGVPLRAVMQRVGHNEPRTTLGVYTHVTEAMRKSAVTALEKV